jgi:hypothetical protein
MSAVAGEYLLRRAQAAARLAVDVMTVRLISQLARAECTQLNVWNAATSGSTTKSTNSTVSLPILATGKSYYLQ